MVRRTQQGRLLTRLDDQHPVAAATTDGITTLRRGLLPRPRAVASSPSERGDDREALLLGCPPEPLGLSKAAFEVRYPALGVFLAIVSAALEVGWLALGRGGCGARLVQLQLVLASRPASAPSSSTSSSATSTRSTSFVRPSTRSRARGSSTWRVPPARTPTRIRGPDGLSRSACGQWPSLNARSRSRQ